ncbi:helix-turn-helix transcriptional regulator [Oerskovia turbata]
MPRPSQAHFVARQHELDVIAAAVGRAAAGDPGAILLGADAGVGKSRLLVRAAELARAAGATVVVSHCVDLGDVGLPYLPFTEALSELRASHDEVDQIIDARPALGRLLDAGPSALDGNGEDQAGRLQLFEAITAVLTTLGRPDAPLVLVIEDLHWADPSTRDVLRFLLARLRADHLLVVASYRADDLHRRHPLRPVLAELRRHPRVDHLALEPFTPAELKLFTAAVAGRSLPKNDFERVMTRSEGNAYFAEELVEAGPQADALPWSLADVLHARLEQLEPDVQQLARIASVAGRVVAEPLLRAVVRQDLGVFSLGGLGADGAPLSRAACDHAFDATLREAVAHHVLTVDGGRIAFRHALLAEAISADLLPGEQVALHRAYLAALTEDPSLGSTAQRAHHALSAHETTTALVASREAARRAGRVLAPAEELRHLEQVLRLWDAVPDAEELLGEDRVDVAVAAAGAASRAGEPDRAVAIARKLVDLSAADPLRQASLRHVLSLHLLGVERVEEVIEHTAAALAVLPAEPPSRDRAWTLATRARAAMNLDRTAMDVVARETAHEAISVARAIDAPDVEADALTTLAVLEVDDADRAAQLLANARERAQAAGDLLTEMRCWYNIAANRYYSGDLDQALVEAHTGLDHAVAAGLGWNAYGVELRLFGELVRYATGDLRRPAASPDPMPPSAVAALTAAQLYAAVARGDEDALSRAQALRPEWRRDGQIALIAGGCMIDALVWSARRDEALTLAQELIVYLGRTWSDYFLGRIWISALALAALADAAEARRLVSAPVEDLVVQGEALLAEAETTALRGRPRGGRLGPEGIAWLVRARAEHSRLVGTNDPALWREATVAFDYGYRYEVARSRWRWAQSLLGVGDREGAAAHAGEALEEAEDMGAGPLAGALRDLARRGRLDLPGLRRSATSVLTDREEEVLLLVAQGLTNRQIGERLFISGKTVSVHVSNVLAKLGASGRTEAVSIAHQRGLIEV